MQNALCALLQTLFLGRKANNSYLCINKNQKAIYEYYRLKKEILGLDKLHFYDVYVPMLQNKNNKKYPFEEGKNIVLSALSILGDDYIANLNKDFPTPFL